MAKPFSQACERNKQPILEKLLIAFSDIGTVLEIGSGTGQHAVHFATHLPHLQWQASDVSENHPGIISWLQDAQLSNIVDPLVLDVNHQKWPIETIEGVFSANTAHIMSWSEVEKMFAGIGRILCAGGVVCLYGPFNYQGKFTSESNASFDEYLRMCAPHRGIRDFEAVDKLAKKEGLVLQNDYPMPANNRLLCWKKSL